MKLFGAVILFLIAFSAVIVLRILLRVRKLYIQFRQYLTGDYDEETFKRMADKHYRGNGEGAQFDKDYFKGTNTGTRFRRQNARQQNQEQQAKTTTTDDGVTIIDQRHHTAANRKIFNNDEGEYVDFVEEE